MKQRTLLSPAPLMACTLAAAFGLGTGWLVHRWRQPQTAIVEDDQSQAGRGSVGADLSGVNSKGRSSTQVIASPMPAGRFDSLAEKLATSPRVERWLLLVAAAEKATAAEMPQLLKLCAGDNAALRMVAARWAELDPRQMWQTLSSAWAKHSGGGEGSAALGLSTYELAQMLFESWAPRDPVAARAVLTEAKDFPGIQNLRMSLLQTFLKNDPETGLRLLNDWNVKHYLPDLKELSAWAAKNPAHAAEVARESGTAIGALKAMEIVGKEWAKHDPAAALAYAAALPPMQRASLAGGVMKEWAANDATAAAAYVSGLGDAAQRARLALPLLESWAKTAPQPALDWAQDTLRGEARASAIGSIVGTLAQQDVTLAAELVTGLDPGGAKILAIGSLVDQWFNKSGAPAVAEWLLKLPEADAREAGFEKLGSQWLWNAGREGGAQAAALITGPQRDLVPANFAMMVINNEARRDPEAALRLVDQLPPAQHVLARDQALSQWFQARPEGAAQWVLSQPAGEGRTSLVTSAARQLAWNTGADETAQKFFSQLPPADRAIASGVLRSIQIPSNEKQALERQQIVLRMLEGK